MSSPMIKVTDARYVYANGAVLALDGVSLEIPEGPEWLWKDHADQAAQRAT